jgi:hypothetical protein
MSRRFSKIATLLLVVMTSFAVLTIFNPTDYLASATPTLALDGYSSGYVSDGTTVNVASFATVNSNDLVYVSVVISDNRVVQSISSTPSLSWTQRTSVGYGNQGHLETYYAIKPAAGSISIQVILTGGAKAAVTAFCISGADVFSPFDVVTPATANGVDNKASSTIATTNANDFIIGALAVESADIDITPDANFNLILTQAASIRSASAEYKIVPSAQSGLTASYSWTNHGSSYAPYLGWAMVVDAVKQANGGPLLVTPEFPYGGLVALLVCLGAFVVFRRRDRSSTQNPNCKYQKSNLFGA